MSGSPWLTMKQLKFTVLADENTCWTCGSYMVFEEYRHASSTWTYVIGIYSEILWKYHELPWNSNVMHHKRNHSRTIQQSTVQQQPKHADLRTMNCFIALPSCWNKPIKQLINNWSTRSQCLRPNSVGLALAVPSHQTGGQSPQRIGAPAVASDPRADTAILGRLGIQAGLIFSSKVCVRSALG